MKESIRRNSTPKEVGKVRHRDDSRRARKVRGVWSLILAIIGIIAVVQELRKPAEERTWHGKVADFVPYDFRMPTMARFRDTYWNPEGSIISSKAFGVGWAPNLGALTRMFRSA
jgi:hypothetical protein